MATILQFTNLTAGITLAASDTLYVAPNITIGNTLNAIILNTGNSVTVDGTAIGDRGIYQQDFYPILTNITIGDNGHVVSTGASSINVNSPTRIVNNGLIDQAGGSYGIFNASNSPSIVINAGAITGVKFGAAIEFSGANAVDNVRNTGVIFGEVYLGGGADIYDGRGGLLNGVLFAGNGNDTLYGGLGADLMDGGMDNDTLYFDSEDLRFGLVLGGSGYDTGYYTDETTPVTINMQAQQLEGYFGSAADEVVIAGNLSGFGLFASTGAGNDLIEGTTVGDNINGGAGIDVLYGRGGLDDLAGGLGGDWIQGGTGADTFRYNALTDSTVNGQDFIADFSTAEGDKINLTNALAGLPAATFNTGFGTGTSVYVFAGGGGTSLVQVYTGATLQMQIVVSQASLAAGDFVL